jgi:putative hemolysin
MNAYKTMMLALGGALLLVACGGEQGTTGIANPASEYCENSGYTLEIVDTREGEYGVCHFPDGETCEEWAFVRGECGIERTFCATQGHTPEVRNGSLVCTTEHGATCPELEFASGRCTL